MKEAAAHLVALALTAVFAILSAKERARWKEPATDVVWDLLVAATSIVNKLNNHTETNLLQFPLQN